VGCRTLIELKNCSSVSIIEPGLVILTINTNLHGGTTSDPAHRTENPLQKTPLTESFQTNSYQLLLTSRFLGS